MEKIKRTQHISSLHYGELPSYGLISDDMNYFLSNMKKTHTFEIPKVKEMIIQGFFGEYPSNGLNPNHRDWSFFICIEAKVFDQLLQAYNCGDLNAIANFSILYFEINFLLPLLLKQYELIRSGKKNVFALEMDRDGKNNYLFYIDRSILATLTYFDH